MRGWAERVTDKGDKTTTILTEKRDRKYVKNKQRARVFFMILELEFGVQSSV